MDLYCISKKWIRSALKPASRTHKLALRPQGLSGYRLLFLLIYSSLTMLVSLQLLEHSHHSPLRAMTMAQDNHPLL